MKRLNILIVDDEKPLVRGLCASLRKEGFNTFEAYDGHEALKIIKNQKFDIILLDIMLPGIEGITLLRKIREMGNIPVIMLTARDDSADMVMGLELGADDYVTKPFNSRVLIARIRSVIRRHKLQHSNEGNFQFNNLVVNFNLREVQKNGITINLTAKEFDILHTLIKNRGVVLSREKIFDTVWQEPDFDTRTVDVHISNLREKIEDDTTKPSFIRTKWGVGYYFAKEG